MKVLNINSYYYSSTVHRNLNLAVRAGGVNTTTYVPVYKGYNPRLECVYGDEPDIVMNECYNHSDRYVFWIKHKKILKNITSVLDVTDYDCIHAHSLFSNGYIALKLNEYFGKPYVVTVRDTDLNIFFKYMPHLRKTGLNILSNASCIVFLSRAYKDALLETYVPSNLRQKFAAKTQVIPNGISKFWLANLGQKRDSINARDIKLIYAGVVSKRKNPIATVEAIKILLNQGYQITFTIVGRIIDRKIYSKIKDLHFVEYIEQVPHEELIYIYRDHDIFIMPSISETFGLVYAEAMSQGLPIIFTRGQGFDGQFPEGIVGYSVDCNDYSEIADKIKQIIQRYDVISANCVNNVSRFDWKLISMRYIDIYKSISCKA